LTNVDGKEVALHAKITNCGQKGNARCKKKRGGIKKGSNGPTHGGFKKFVNANPEQERMLLLNRLD
jgi:hypothetical protein